MRIHEVGGGSWTLSARPTFELLRRLITGKRPGPACTMLEFHQLIDGSWLACDEDGGPLDLPLNQSVLNAGVVGKRVAILDLVGTVVGLSPAEYRDVLRNEEPEEPVPEEEQRDFARDRFGPQEEES